jgi:hypothetical protein
MGSVVGLADYLCGNIIKIHNTPGSAIQPFSCRGRAESCLWGSGFEVWCGRRAAEDDDGCSVFGVTFSVFGFKGFGYLWERLSSRDECRGPWNNRTVNR